jgi:hypothetical protein
LPDVGVLPLLKANAEHVEAGFGRHTTVVGNFAATVEHGNLEPGIKPLETGGPDDGANVVRAEVDLGRRGIQRDRRRRVG